ncbi:MAG TPA: Fur family transcriptional regulator [Candidatus Saccharimonadales bacterium]|nr:Fur family transcriptional regulator [Candidatus Saccharimonadales bacterium]
MSEPLEQFKALLRQKGQSVTRSRMAVFKALQNQEPQTMREVAEACAGQVDRASIYRTITLFEELGIVQRLQIGWKYKLELSDAFHRHHHHLTCQQCGRTIPLPEDRQLEERLRTLSENQDFVMKGHQLEIQGLCQNCL